MSMAVTTVWLYVMAVCLQCSCRMYFCQQRTEHIIDLDLSAQTHVQSLPLNADRGFPKMGLKRRMPAWPGNLWSRLQSGLSSSEACLTPALVSACWREPDAEPPTPRPMHIGTDRNWATIQHLVSSLEMTFCQWGQLGTVYQIIYQHNCYHYIIITTSLFLLLLCYYIVYWSIPHCLSILHSYCFLNIQHHHFQNIHCYYDWLLFLLIVSVPIHVTSPGLIVLLQVQLVL